MWFLLPFLCLGCSSLLPILWIVILPFYAAFCGPQPVLRLSILMAVHSGVMSLIPAVVVSTIPLVQLGIVCALLSLPVNFAPYTVVWLYDKLIWISEPLLLTIEAIQLVRFIMYQSHKLVTKLEDEPSFTKFLMLALAAMCYSLSMSVCVLLRSQDSPIPTWLIFVLWLLALGMLICAVISEAGNIVDVSVVTFAMFAAIWAMNQESNIAKHPIQTPQGWYSDDLDKRSFLHLLYSMIMTSLVQVTNISQTFQFLYNLISPSFLLLVGIRVASILHAVSLIPRGSDEAPSQSYLEEEINTTSLLNWKSPLIIKLTLIFVYTQLVVYNIEAYSCKDAIGNQVFQGLVADFGLSRLWQVFVFVAVYIYRLYNYEDFVAEEF